MISCLICIARRHQPARQQMRTTTPGTNLHRVISSGNHLAFNRPPYQTRRFFIKMDFPCNLREGGHALTKTFPPNPNSDSYPHKMNSPFTFMERTRFKRADFTAVMASLLVDLRKLARRAIKPWFRRS